MARGRGPVLIVSSLLLAGGAAWMANKWITSRAMPVQGGAPTRILTAAMNLPLGTQISVRQVASIEMIPGQEPAGTFHDEKEIDGKVTSVNVPAGQLLMASMFSKEGENALAANVEKDKRAVTVRVDDVVGVAGFLLPGNRVDVVATRKDDHTGVVSSETILSNIKVLAVDQTAATNSSEPVVVRAVTLEVSPEEAETLLKGKAAGSIQLALRNPLDDSDARHKLPEPVKAIAKLPERVAAPARDPSITVIRGTSVAHEAERE
ncbi:MAG: Flp pilus assembly protein CpaB [Steroidobacterales bacterium]